MKKVLFGILFLELVMVSPVPTMAEVNVGINIGIPLPPAIVFTSPPQLIVLPGTYVYVSPDVDADIFFYNGWWWRPWEGRWYRSREYKSGWSYHNSVPSFYREIPRGWRNDYRKRHWKGHKWDQQRIPHQEVQRNWKGWKENKHWEKKERWGVKELQPQQSRPQLKEGKPERSHQKTDPQSRKEVESKHPEQQKENHKKENGEKKGK